MSTTPRTDALKLSDCATTIQEARGVIDRQEALIAELRKDRARLIAELAEVRSHAERVNNANDLLSIEVASLNADKARLDWLDHNAIPWVWMSPERIDKLGPIVVTWKSNRALRAAIDAAMEATK
jgi:hypothetical protein